jgi:hypothetical protein
MFAAEAPVGLVLPSSLFKALGVSEGLLFPIKVSFGAKYRPFPTRARTPSLASLARALDGAAGVAPFRSSAQSKDFPDDLALPNAMSVALRFECSLVFSLVFSLLVVQLCHSRFILAC